MDSRRKVFPVVSRAKMVSARPKWAGVAYSNKSCTSWQSIYAVQTHLKAMGLYPYEPDGKWGVATYNALVKSGYTFQQLSGGCTPPVPPGILGRAAADWPGYPEPIPPTCWNNPAFQEEYWEKNNAIWDECGVEAAKTLKDDPNSTCGVRSGSTAIKPSVLDCQQMLFEPRHDKMARDLMAKYDCLEGGSGAASESGGSSGGGGSSGSGSSSTNFMLWGLGAAAVIGGLGWFFLRGPGKKYMGNPVTHVVSTEKEAQALAEDMAWNDYLAVVGRLINVDNVSGYMHEDSYNYDGINAVVEVQDTGREDVLHWGDSEWLDPYWDVRVVSSEPGDLPSDLRTTWTDGPSIHIVQKPYGWTVTKEKHVEQMYSGNPLPAGIENFDGDQHNLFNTLVLSAVNDGDAYRDNRNAEKAVKTAWKELRRTRDEALKEDYDVVRKVAVREVAKRWKSW